MPTVNRNLSIERIKKSRTGLNPVLLLLVHICLMDAVGITSSPLRLCSILFQGDVGHLLLHLNRGGGGTRFFHYGLHILGKCLHDLTVCPLFHLKLRHHCLKLLSHSGELFGGG